MPAYLFITTIIATLWITTSAVAQELPGVMTMPWRFVGIDAADVAPARAPLEQVRQVMINRYTAGGQNLTVTAGNPPAATMNLRRITDLIIAGTPRGVRATTPISVEPVWCSLMDRFVVFIAVSDAASGELLSLTHRTFAKDAWRGQAAGAGLANYLRGPLGNLADTAIASIKDHTNKTDSLHVRLDIGRALDRQDEGSAQCYGLLAAQSIMPDFTTDYAFATDRRATVFRVLGLPLPKPLRPTRRVIARWDPGVPPRTLPFTANLTATYAESVGGRSIPGPQTLPTQWRAVGPQIQVTGLDELHTWIVAERDTLKHQDLPQVAKVYYGWVYLDRGRAWGLKMKDRLATKVGDEWILGHVVRFFGPEENLKSPRGYDIREGAILYLRKGQRHVRIGQTFQFDPKDFPANWPPEKRAELPPMP